MAKQVFATKGNLIQAKKSLVLAKTGYDLMDRKRNVLIREMMELVDKVKLIRDEITKAYEMGYYNLQQANLSSGVITNIVRQVPVDNGVHLTYRSVMGVEVPNVSLEDSPLEISYGLENSSSSIDEAYIQFQKIKKLTVILAEVDNSVYRLANVIRKTQKRANALKNIVIPNFEWTIKNITEVLEEKEREEFSRLKVIKQNKLKGDTK
ncbi:MAG: V-type ATP synthase subunit D [Erysipelotrichaceae bacterium]|nr:V-type ATP synthase subunit D [Erysipelotrichaceae bacterium]